MEEKDIILFLFLAGYLERDPARGSKNAKPCTKDPTGKDFSPIDLASIIFE